MRTFKEFIFFLLFVCLSPTINCFNLNSPTVLLPWSSNSSGAVSHFIKVIPEDQCFVWKLKIAGIVSITESSSVKGAVQCINGLKIRPIRPTLSRESSTVFITSTSQDVSLRCDIIVDGISRLEIVTRTRELSVGETFEKIELLAYDSKGNVFTSLLGLKFNWKMNVTSVSPVKVADSIMQISMFEATSYTTNQEILDLEKQGLHGSSILVHPVNTGEIRLSVEYSDVVYDHVISDSVTILVRDEVILESTEERCVLKGSIIVVEANRLVHRRYYKIELPSSQHKFKISNDSVVSLRAGLLRAVGIGSTSVSIIDSFIPTQLQVEFPKVVVNVFDPDSVESEAITEVSNGVLEIYKNYDFEISLKAHGKVLSLSNIRLKSKISLNNDVATQSLHDDGKHFTIGAKTEGLVKVSVTVFGYFNDEKIFFSLDTPLESSFHLRVVKPLSIHPSSTIYLVDRANYTSPFQRIKYAVSGGTGEYQHVYENGLKYIEVISSNELSVRCLVGTYYITFRDFKSPYLNVLLTVHVYPISKVQFKYQNYETFTETAVSMNVDVYVRESGGHKNFKVYDFGTLPFVYTSSNGAELTELPSKELSNSVSFSSDKAGRYSVSVSLGLLSTDTSMVVVYQPVQLENTDCDYQSALTGTLVSLIVSGGPYKHPDGDGFFGHLSVVDDNVPSIIKVHRSNFLLSRNAIDFTIECLSRGTADLAAVFGNNASKSLPDPVTVNFNLGKFYCLSVNDISRTDVIFLKPKIAHGCTNLHLTEPATSSVSLALYRDEKSLPLCSLPSFSVNLTGASVLDNKQSRFLITPTDDSRVYEFKSSEKLTGLYKLNMNFRLDRSETSRIFKVTFTVNFVTHPSMKDGLLTLYAHEGDTFVVDILGGSDRIDFTMSEPGIVVPSLTKQPRGALLSIVPSREGFTKISITDFCLDTKSDAPPLEVRVISAASMKVHFNDVLMIGATTKIELEFFAKDNELIKAEKFKFLEIEMDKSSNSFLHTFDLKADVHRNRLFFDARAVESGVTEIIFTLRSSGVGNDVVKIINIESFSSVSVAPSVINALPMMKFPLRITGGPNKLKKSHYVFEFKNGSGITNVDSTDYLLTTKDVGITTILVKSVSLNGDLVYSHTELIVTCSPPYRIELHSPQDVILQGNTIPLHVSFRSEHGFITDGVLPAALNFEWSSESAGVSLMTYWNRDLALDHYADDYILAKFSHCGRSSVFIRVGHTEAYKRFFLNELTASTSLEVIEPTYLTAKSLSAQSSYVPVMFKSVGLHLPVNGAYLDVYATDLHPDIKDTHIINWKIVHAGKDSAILFSCEGLIITPDGTPCNSRSPVRAESRSLVGSTTLVAFWNSQSIPVVLNTNSVQQLFVCLINPAPLQTVHGVLSFPCNHTAEFLVVSLDSLGNPFSTLIPADYTIEVFDGDVAEVTNNLAVNATFTILTTKYGSGVVRVSHPDCPPFIARFSVIHGLAFSDATRSGSDLGLDSVNKVTLGGVAVISSVFAKSNFIEWSIGDHKICRVVYSDNKFAVLMGLSVGSTLVNVMEGSARIGTNRLEVYESEELKFTTEGDNMVSNYLNSKVCSYLTVNETWTHPSVDLYFETHVPDYPVTCVLRTSTDANNYKKKWIEDHFSIRKYFDTASMNFKCCIEALPSIAFNPYYKEDEYKKPEYDNLSLDVTLGSFKDSIMVTLVDSFTIQTDYSDSGRTMYVANADDPTILDFTGPPLKLHTIDDTAHFMVVSDPRHLQILEVYTDDSYCIDVAKSLTDPTKKWLTISLVAKENCKIEKYRSVSVFVKSDLTEQHVRLKVMMLEGRKPVVIGRVSQTTNHVLAFLALILMAVCIVAIVFLLTVSKQKDTTMSYTSSPLGPNKTHISLSTSGYGFNDSMGNASHGHDSSQMVYSDASCLSRSFGRYGVNK